MQPNTNLAWASGLFEGEGWISIQGYTPSIGLQTCDLDVLKRFQEVIGFGPIYSRKIKIYKYEHIKSRKKQWAWRVTGFEKVQYCICLLWNGLGKRRRKRAKGVLKIACKGALRPGMPKGHKSRFVPKHGDIRKYWRGCHCVKCKKANKNYSRLLSARY